MGNEGMSVCVCACTGVGRFSLGCMCEVLAEGLCHTVGEEYPTVVCKVLYISTCRMCIAANMFYFILFHGYISLLYCVPGAVAAGWI